MQFSAEYRDDVSSQVCGDVRCPWRIDTPASLSMRCSMPHDEGVPMKATPGRLGFAWLAYLPSPDAHGHRAHHRVRQLVAKRL